MKAGTEFRNVVVEAAVEAGELFSAKTRPAEESEILQGSAGDGFDVAPADEEIFGAVADDEVAFVNLFENGIELVENFGFALFGEVFDAEMESEADERGAEKDGGGDEPFGQAGVVGGDSEPDQDEEREGGVKAVAEAG